MWFSFLLISVIAFLVFLLWRSLSKQDKRKSILYDDQYDDIRENVVNHDEEGAGKSTEWDWMIWQSKLFPQTLSR